MQVTSWSAGTLAHRTGARVLSDASIPDALTLCSLDPVGTVLAACRLERALSGGPRFVGELWGYEEDDELLAACSVGATLVPLVPPGLDPATRLRALTAFADLAQRRHRGYSSLVGPAETVLGLWQRLRGGMRAARDIRADQPSMVIDTPPLVEPDASVRPSRLGELDVVLPACVRMFTEEIGYSPLTGGGGIYEARVRDLISRGRSFVRMSMDDEGHQHVVFKAELAAVACGVAQVQGVWVTPSRRGEGLSETGMAAVVQAAQRDVAPVVTLYANAYNHRALAAYRAVGFRQVGTYATVLL